MNNKKKKSKILGLFATLALGFAGLGVGTAIAQPEVKTASALTYTTYKYLTYGTTSDGDSTSNGCPSNFKIYMYKKLNTLPPHFSIIKFSKCFPNLNNL